MNIVEGPYIIVVVPGGFEIDVSTIPPPKTLRSFGLLANFSSRDMGNFLGMSL